MVKILSPNVKQAIADAVTEAERTTSAEIVVVVSPASDAYQSTILIYGILLGSIVAMSMWAAHLVTLFPLLLAIQFAVIAVLSLIPPLRHLFLPLVPKRIRHHRAAHRAYEEYLSVSRHLPASAPILLLYISLAEHYAHIITSRSVREKIPDDRWNPVISMFTTSMKNAGLQNACIAAIQEMAQRLTPHFPESVETYHIPNNVIEVGH